MMGDRRLVRLDQLSNRRGPRPSLWGALYRDHRGAYRLRLSRAAARLAGGPGYYAVAVQLGTELVLLRTQRRPYALCLGRDCRMSAGLLLRAEPWLEMLVGWVYPADPVQGGVALDLTMPLRRLRQAAPGGRTAGNAEGTIDETETAQPTTHEVDTLSS